jgi:hypothetical protein
MSDDTLRKIKELLDGAPAEEVVTLTRAELDALRAAAAPAPAAPEIPAAPQVPAPVAAAAAQQGPSPPPGKAPLTIADLSTIGQAEALARMDEVEALEREEQNQRRAS